MGKSSINHFSPCRKLFQDSPMPAPLWQGRRAGGPVTLGRRAMFSHHIIAPSKRQAIKEWAATE